MEQYKTVEEAAEILRVCTRSVYDAVRSGRLRATRPMRSWLITDDAIREFVEGGRSSVVSETPQQAAPKANPLANRKNKRR